MQGVAQGGGFVSNVQLGAEQSVVTGLNERGALIGPGQSMLARGDSMLQCDVANPRHQFKITHVQVIISDVAPVATLLECGIMGLDGDPPVVDAQRFYGRGNIVPLQDTTMKVPIVTNDLLSGDTFFSPYWVGNGNLNIRQQNAGASQNALMVNALDDPWQKIDNKAVNASTFAQFFTVFFRRLVDVP